MVENWGEKENTNERKETEIKEGERETEGEKWRDQEGCGSLKPWRQL